MRLQVFSGNWKYILCSSSDILHTVVAVVVVVVVVAVVLYILKTVVVVVAVVVVEVVLVDSTAVEVTVFGWSVEGGEAEWFGRIDFGTNGDFVLSVINFDEFFII